MDMVASSVQTFLNAMTYPDKTLYPISSRNDKDFCQLMDVYLDAVFYPAMKENPKIFIRKVGIRRFRTRASWPTAWSLTK